MELTEMIEAWHGPPKNPNRAHPWFIDGKKKNCTKENLIWGEISQKKQKAFMERVKEYGFFVARKQFDVSFEFALIIVNKKNLPYGEQIDLLHKKKVSFYVVRPKKEKKKKR